MTTVREALYIAAIVILLAAFGFYTYHERSVGKQTIEKQDTTATDKALAEAKEQTAALQSQADTANKAAQDAQTQLNAYIADNPIQPVRLCNTHYSDPSVPQTANLGSGTQGPSTAPGAVPAVPQPTSGPDLSGGLTVLMQSAGRLATLYAEYQQR